MHKEPHKRKCMRLGNCPLGGMRENLQEKCAQEAWSSGHTHRVQLLQTAGDRAFVIHCPNRILELGPGNFLEVGWQTRFSCMAGKARELEKSTQARSMVRSSP